MTTKNLLLGALIVACVVKSFVLLSPDRGNSAKRRDLARELAAFVAAELARGTERGEVLVLAPMDEEADPFPATLAGRMEKQLTQAGFSPVDVVRVPYNMAIESTGEPVGKADFLAALRAHPQSRLVVSLVGVPRLAEADLPVASRPRMVVASNVLMPYLNSLPRGLMDFAIEVKRNSVTDKRESPELGELSNYFVLTRFAR